MGLSERDRKILGISFFQGTAAQAVDRMSAGGLLVVPAAPALKDLEVNASYREALLDADMAITDSAFMVLVWNYLQRDTVTRLSGLTYLVELLTRHEIRDPGNCFWVMASPKSAAKNLEWLASESIVVPDGHIHHAPKYGDPIVDAHLLEEIERLRPQHIIITVGGGTQERLGVYIKRNVSYRPAIHCLGAAIAFLSGDQVRIPAWADRSYMGWFFRVFSDPKRYVPRYWQARKLATLMYRYRDRLPHKPPTVVAALSEDPRG